MERRKKRSELSAALCNASILLYLTWLLLPAVQTTGRAVTGAACVMLFGVGALLHCPEGWKKSWPDLAARAFCAAAMPLLLRAFLERGGTNFAGYYVQQVMFWFPLVYAGYAHMRGDRRLWRGVKWVMLIAISVTVCTTIGWLIQGMLRGGRVYAYSRSLGYAGDVNPAYLKELMLRNIGGYDFVYAMVLALPLTCIGVQSHTGWKRAGFVLLAAVQTVMIVLSQYTYAMLYAAAIWAMELLALAVRRRSKGRIGMGKSLLIGAAPIVLGLALLYPLSLLGAAVCEGLGLSHFAHSFELLSGAFTGQAADSRLSYYRLALRGFAASPLIGSMLGGEKLLSQHSEVLDLLSGMGVLGTCAVCGMIWVMGRGLLKGMRRCPHRAQLGVMAAALLVISLLGTVNYSRDIMAVAAMGTLLVLESRSE